jgi:RNA polymerase sigma factor (sigma-70 family)
MYISVGITNSFFSLIFFFLSQCLGSTWRQIIASTSNPITTSVYAMSYSTSAPKAHAFQYESEIISQMPQGDVYRDARSQLRRQGLGLPPESSICFWSPTLSCDQEMFLFRELARLRQADHLDAADQGRLDAVRRLLVESNVRLVVREVRRLTPRPDQFGEYVSAGFVGLLRAVEAFDIDRGTPRFAAYATLCIRRAIFTQLHQDGRHRLVPVGDESLVLDNVPDRHDDTKPVDDRDVADHALAQLSDQQRQAITAIAEHGPSEAARRLGLSRQALLYHAGHARQRAAVLCGV